MGAPLKAFFAQFANLGFTYRGNLTAYINFVRLCKVLKQNESSAKLLPVARSDFNDARVKQFNFIYGTNSDLAAWQNLCSVIDITPVPDDIKKCQDRVWNTHVNIVDLLESARTGEQAQTFATLKELKEYTLRPGNKFPKKSAYAGGLLKDLLREIDNPYFGRRQKGSEKMRKKKAVRHAATTQSSS